MKTKLLIAIMFVGVTTLFAQNVPSYVPTNGLVGWWPFNGNANDESGNGNHGTVNGAVLTSDRIGNNNSSYSFNGTSNEISVTNKLLNLVSDFSISCWIASSDITKIQQCIFNSIEHTGFVVELNNENIPSNKLMYGVGPANAYWSLIYAQGKYNQFQNNTWHHIVFVKSGTTYTLLLNNEIDGSSVVSVSSNYDQSVGIRFGSIGGHEFFKGKLDDFAVYNRALTQQEISALYNGGTQSSLATTKVFVDAPATVNQNQEVELSISTEALNTADNVIAYQTDFSYDTTRFTYVGSNLVGTLNPAGTVGINKSKNGLLQVGYMSQTALSGAGSLVKLKFKANNSTGQGIFGLANFMYNNTTISSLKSDTVTTLDVTPPTAKITYTQNPVRKGDSLLITVKFSEKMAVLPVPQLNLTGQNTLSNTNLTKVNDTTYTFWWVVEKGNGAVNVTLATGKDVGGNAIVATPMQNASFTILPTVFGDVDTNSFVRAYDAALALQYSVGLNPLPTMDPLPWSNWRIAVANVDTVGNVTANDASLILQKSIGQIATFPADAKKRAGDAPSAEVTVKREGNQLVFRTTGTLYGFNVFFKDNFNVFGQPTINDKNAIVATNIKTNTYNVGLASTTPLAENEPFLIIPIVSTNDVSGTMDVIVNTQEKSLAYGGALAINEATITTMHLYPNPTKDVVTIQNATGKMVQIMDVQGRMIHKQTISSDSHEISLKSIGAKGTYILHIVDGNGISIQENKIVLE